MEYLGQDGNGDDRYAYQKGFTNNAKFTATPASGYKFKQWVYRTESTLNAESPTTSKSNPFTYTGRENIYIRAESEASSSGGGDTDEDWTYHTPINWGWSSGEEAPEVINMTKEYYLYRIPIRFEYSGELTVYTTGSLNTMGFVSESEDYDSPYDEFDRDTGYPLYYFASDDDSGSGNNFKIVCDIEADVHYTIWIRGRYGTETGSTTIYITSPTKETTTVKKWSWSDSNGTASAAETVGAKTAIDSFGLLSEFSHKVWNDMIDKVSEIISLENDVWYDNYDSVANTRMTSSDKVLTAQRFNSLRFNIGARENAPSTGITDRVAGDTVYGSYFTTLTDCINGWIDNL